MKRFNKMTEIQMTKTNGGGWAFAACCAVATAAGSAIGVGSGMAGWNKKS